MSGAIFSCFVKLKTHFFTCRICDSLIHVLIVVCLLDSNICDWLKDQSQY